MGNGLTCVVARTSGQQREQRRATARATALRSVAVMATNRAHHPADLAVSLEQEWAQLAGSQRLCAALAAWALIHPVLAGYPDGELLRLAVHDRLQVTYDDRDDILLALVVQAAADGGDDPLAARVLLQLLMPGVIALQRRLSGLILDPEERDAQVMCAVMETIRGYPWRRRPAKVAANILLDTHMRVRRQRRRTVVEVPVDAVEDHPAAADEDSGRVELLELFLWAVTEGVVSVDDALLITRTHIDAEPVEDVADELGVARKTLLRRRQRALACLTAAAPRYAAAAA